MQHTRPALLVLSALAIVTAVAAPATRGQTARPSPALTGTWQLEGSIEQAQQSVERGVAPAVRGLTPDIERLARARIAETTWAPETIEVRATADRIHVTFAGVETRTFDTPPGEPQNVYSRSGVRAQMTQTYRPDGGIQQQFRALDGVQYNFLVPQADGQHLNLDVLMESRRLAQDVRFRLSYRKR